MSVLLKPKQKQKFIISLVAVLLLSAFNYAGFGLQEANAATDGSEDAEFLTNIGSGFDGSVLASGFQSDGSIILAGSFATFNGNPRSRVVKLNADGTEDLDFASNFGPADLNGTVYTIAVQEDDKILIGGSFTQAFGGGRKYLIRLLADGTLDLTFSTNLGTGFDSDIYSLAIDSAGKIIVGGGFFNFKGNPRTGIVRLNPNGTEDVAFYNNLGTGFGGGALINALDTDPADDSVLVGGLFSDVDGTPAGNFARLDSAGNFDAAFNTNLGTGFDSFSSAIFVRNDQSILVGGGFNTFDGQAVGKMLALNADGTLDTTFTSNLGTGFNGTVRSLAFQNSDEKIVLGGEFTTLNGQSSPHLVRLFNDGTEDTIFSSRLGSGFNAPVGTVGIDVNNPLEKLVVGGDFTVFRGQARGFVTRMSEGGELPAPAANEDTDFYDNLGTAFDGQVNAVASQPDGKILVGGSYNDFNGHNCVNLVRLNLDGTEDAAFCDNLGSGFNSAVFSITVQSDGKIIVTGSFDIVNGVTSSAVVRLNADGTIDEDFTDNLGTGFNGEIYEAAVQPDGKIILVGIFGTFNGDPHQGIIRLNATGTIDQQFSDNMGTGLDPSGSAQSLALQPDGKIVVSGSFINYNGIPHGSIFRLNSDGTEDTAFYDNLGVGFNETSLSIQLQDDNKIVLGGQFTTLDNNVRNHLVRLNSDGTEDTAFYDNLGAGFIDRVVSIQVQSDDKILVGGSFNMFDNNSRNRLVRLNGDGTEDTDFYDDLGIGFDGEVDAIAFDEEENIVVGGQFGRLNDFVRHGLVRLFSGISGGGDVTDPIIVDVTSSTPNGTYGEGEIISIQIEFSEVVNVITTGVPTLALDATGTALSDPSAEYVSGSGTNTLTFRYTVAAGNASPDLDYSSDTALALNGGSIKDAAANDADLTLPDPGNLHSLSTNKALVIDTTEDTGGNNGGGTTSGNNPTPGSGGSPTPPAGTSNVVLPYNVVAGQPIKFSCGQTVYLVTVEGLYPFAAYSTLQFYFAQSGQTLVHRPECSTLPYTILAPIDSIPGFIKVPSGTLVKVAGDQTVWRIENGVARPITSMQVFLAHGYKVSDIYLISTLLLANFPSGELIN
jgi:uncharacterized delta-60 repeat protein